MNKNKKAVIMGEGMTLIITTFVIIFFLVAFFAVSNLFMPKQIKIEEGSLQSNEAFVSLLSFLESNSNFTENGQQLRMKEFILLWNTEPSENLQQELTKEASKFFEIYTKEAKWKKNDCFLLQIENVNEGPITLGDISFAVGGLTKNIVKIPIPLPNKEIINAKLFVSNECLK